MKYRRILAMLVTTVIMAVMMIALVAIPVGALTQTPAQPATSNPIYDSMTGSISGYVYGSDGKTAIEGATVSIWNYAQNAVPWSPVSTNITEADGHYSITGLAGGEYAVAAVADGHERLFYQDVHLPQEPDPVTVIEGQETYGISFSLGPGGTISGTVTLQGDDTTLAEVSVDAINIKTTGGVTWVALTDGNGEYTLDGLPYGDYRVSSPSPRYRGSGDDSYIMEVWQEKPLGETPDNVTVDEETNPNDIDFTLEGGGTISGHVYESSDGPPVAGAAVQAFVYDSISSGPWLLRGVGFTNEDGSYQTAGLPDGKYAVRVVADGYATEWWDHTYYKDEASYIEVSVPGNVPDIDFHLEPGGSISGNVSYLDNGTPTPIPSLHVYATDNATNKWIAGVNTDASGNYTLPGLPDGSYRVRACASCSGLPYIDEWYDGVYNQNEATPVPVTSPGDTGDINFTLEPGGTISGHVYESTDGPPVAGARIQVIDYDSILSYWVQVSWAQTDDYGYYEASGLPTGKYGVRVEAAGFANEWYNGTYYREEATPVEVTAPGSIGSIDFNLEPGGSISGHVYESDGKTPISNFHVNTTETETNHWTAGVDTNADGYYVLSGIPDGSYWVRTCVRCTGTHEPYIDEWYKDAFNQSGATPVPVSAPDDTGGIDFILELGGTISGNVTDGTNPIEGADIEVIEYDSLSGYWFSYDGTRTGADGNYVTGGLPTGKYAVRARAEGYATEWYDGTYLTNEAESVSVTVGENTPDISFSLEVGGTISGTVTDQVTSLRLANVSVEAKRVDESGGDGATTDHDGNYTISGLPYGDYHVCSPGGGRWGSGDDGYLTEYWQECSGPPSPTPIVTLDSENPDWANINFTLEVGGTITGCIIGSDTSEPIPNLHVYAINSETYQWMSGVYTDVSGNYTLSGLPDGSYLVNACASCSGLKYVDEWYDDVYNRDEADPVPVTVPDNTPDINFVLDPGGTISGNVTDGYEPIANLHVYATDNATWQWTAGSNTDASGNYTLVVPTGSYLVRACASCSGLSYVDEWYDDVYNQDEADPVSVTVPGNTPDINFVLDPGGTISGNVTDGTNPVEGADIQVIEYDSLSGYWVSYDGTRTNADGNYVTGGLPTGTYAVRVQAEGYIAEWYNGTYFQNEAESVSVTVGKNTPDIDFVLETGGTLSGNVSDGYEPIANLHVYATDNATWQWMAGSNTDASGNYTLVLPTGNYFVNACGSCSGLNYVDEWYDDVYNPAEATPVPVTVGEDTTGIDFVLEVGGTISGHVIDAVTLDPIVNLHVYASDNETGEWVAGGNTDVSGNYTLVVPTGSYLVLACASCSGLNYVNEWYNNVYNQNEATPVSVTAPGDMPGIDFSLESPRYNYMTYLGMSVNIPPLDNPKVRLAIYLALDRQTIADWAGGAKVLSIATPFEPCPNMEQSYDPMKAKQLLAEAGYSSGFGIILTAYPDLEDLANMIKAYLAAVGIDAQIDLLDQASFYSQLQNRSLDFFLTDTMVNWENTPELLGRLLLSQGAENFTGYTNTQFDDLFNSGSYGEAEDTAFEVDSGGFATGPLFWSLEAFIPGDASEDGVVDSLDLQVEKQVVLGELPPNWGADANQDGRMNVLDLVEIKRIIIGS
jgi:uncharacterized protein (DUF2141 family)